MNKPMILLATLLVFGFAFAEAPAGIGDALIGVRNLVCDALPILVMVAIVAAAILYAVGQLGSAESRAKFHGWATNIALGAITAILVYVVAPWILGALMSNSAAFSCTAARGGNI